MPEPGRTGFSQDPSALDDGRLGGYSLDTMNAKHSNRPPLIAGALSGIAGLLVFLLIHHFWITPIWFVLPLGLLIAALGGLAVGWAYGELQPTLPSRPWTAPAIVALMAVILLPSFVLAELREPMFDVTAPAGVLLISTGGAAMHFILELLVTSTLVGAFAGWLIGRTARAALATALAGLVFALGPGHNIPFLGGTPGSPKGSLLLLVVAAVSAVVLVEVERRLSGEGKHGVEEAMVS